jgi:hypothetical protein
MAPDATAAPGWNAEVMAAVDNAAADRPEFVVADVNRDEAWLSMRADDAPALDDWR